MDETIQTQARTHSQPGFLEAWQMVLGQLQGEMSRAMFDTWVQPLRPVSLQNGVFTLGAYNPYARDWVESRLAGRIGRLMEGLYHEPVKLQVTVINGFYDQPLPPAETPPSIPPPKEKKSSEPSGNEIPTTTRKIMLQRAYGSERARLIQPERGMFVTLYFFYEWLPLLGHSAFATILAARSLCFWNPMTGELRNTIETEMGALAQRAAVSVRTIKDVLNDALVKQYFLRYRVRRVMTVNGVRTAGILLQVRMDDPLTPADQELSGIAESEHWFTLDFAVGDEEAGE
ncbi:MAG TPA: DnaA N-terminal domain-containing protein [Longilinea sp.]|nr:DnaA N-terminal domain-containing protein [Longilinea sp.]